MENQTLDELISLATSQFGQRYIETRNTLLERYEQAPADLLERLEAFAVDSSDWRTQLTVQILKDWIKERTIIELCNSYVTGHIPRPKPMSGFTAVHRAEALASLGPAATPRVLEMLWKSQEYADQTEFSALVGALSLLKDPRAERPMLEFVEQKRSAQEVKGGLRVLRSLELSRADEILFEIAEAPTSDHDLRLYAIRNLGKVKNPRASEVLTRILLDEKLGADTHLAAARGLKTRADPETRRAVAKALAASWSEPVILTLIRLLREIGTSEEFKALRRAAHVSPAARQYAEEAIEEIQQRH